MTIITSIEQFLYTVSTALYLPVIAACALLVLYAPWVVGMALFEACQRREGTRVWLASFRDGLGRGDLGDRSDSTDRAVQAEWWLQVQESQLEQSLDRVRFVIKVGPALGLMGTLIPMGISLASLASGNIPEMASTMVTAFTATVAGLATGTVAYLVALTRERWAREDLRDMAVLAEDFITMPSVSDDGEVEQARHFPSQSLQTGGAAHALP